MPLEMDEAESSLDLSEAGALARVPARWAVATLADAEGRAVQLVCWKNPRRTLSNRLVESPDPSRRVNWAQTVRQVRWQRVDSAFEADWVYLQTARRLFPETYREMVPWIETCFVHVDPEEEFPRYVKTAQLPRGAGHAIGPFAHKGAAGRFIELVEDAFDLCRYYNILLQYPHGKACAYKEMGKCPAPCDGSISMEQYRRMIELSVGALADPGAVIAEQSARMEQAAAELRFETAGKIKAYIAQLAEFGHGALRYAKPLADFAFVTVQAGPRAGRAKVFLILPGRVELVACLLSEPGEPRELLDVIWRRAEERGRAADAECIGLAARHLFAPLAADRELFIPLAQVDRDSILAAYRLASRKLPPPADKMDIGDADGTETDAAEHHE